MTKIYFVGMHNKPNTLPLCSSTKSGKLINRIIDVLPPATYIKTNLYNVDYYPAADKEKRQLAIEFANNHSEILANDIVVLLGAEVHTNFPRLRQSARESK